MTPTATTQLTPLFSVKLLEADDIVAARQRARHLSAHLGFSHQDQVWIATAVSEVARNAFQHAGGGQVEFALATQATPQYLTVQVIDHGPGIGDRSRVGAGLGLAGTRRLMDMFEVDSIPGRGTTVRFAKALPQKLDTKQVAGAVAQLAQQRSQGPLEEVQTQNLELLRVFEQQRDREIELERRKAELSRLNSELEETNRGVVALYAELDEKAAALRRADELKSRFLWHMSHEFRTPINSILALAQLLLNRTDGELTSEQERQVGYIRRSAQDVLEMVNDLLDLAKVESGTTDVRRSPIDLGQLFGALRGMLRPLAANDAVALVFEETPLGLTFLSDEAKVAQILRNLISNGLKFTEAGEVRVSARQIGDRIQISVADTGIGIAPEDQVAYLQEFAQVENPVQRRVKGTGLGLPLSRKLAMLLGGELRVASTPGEGSTFTLMLPGAVSLAASEKPEVFQAEYSGPILIIDDEDTDRYITRQIFRGTRRPILEASGGMEGAERARFEKPALIILDLIMPERDGFDVLDDLKSDPATRDIPVVIHTSKRLGASDYERLAGRQAAVLPKGGGAAGVFDLIREILGEPDLFHGAGK